MYIFFVTFGRVFGEFRPKFDTHYLEDPGISRPFFWFGKDEFAENCWYIDIEPPEIHSSNPMGSL